MSTARGEVASRDDGGYEDRGVGARLRAERERQGLSLRKLAAGVGISPSALSQIETGRSKPSVSTLYAIVRALGMSLDELFGAGAHSPATAPERSGEGDGSPVLRRDRRKTLELESGVRWERLTPVPDQQLDFLDVTYEVGGASSAGNSFNRHQGREHGVVLKGRLRVKVGFEEYELGPGDSIAFDSSLPHRLENVGKVPVRAVWCVVGRYGSDPRRERLEGE